MNELYDAIVLGGGPGGATAGLLLARAGWRVAIIEKARFPRRKVCGEYVSNLPLLRRLGVAEDFRKLAGPPVREVGLFAGETVLSAPMPRSSETLEGWGRGLGREVLDTMMLDHAAGAGAHVWQPWGATRLERRGDISLCETAHRENRQAREFRTKVVIAANGSSEPGTLPAQPVRRALRSSDLLGFKAHFRDSALLPGLMPLLVFPGGYGGMVHSNDGRVSLSCCIRRDEWERLRRARPRNCAAETVFEHIRKYCRGAREALAGACLDGGWMSAGAIRPGIRERFAPGLFSVGNAAGEAHPIIAEGISMAMQSAWLLCERLVRGGKELSSAEMGEIGRDYSAAWRRSLAGRIRIAGLLSQVAVRPVAVSVLLPLFRLFPSMLTLGAKWSGKREFEPTTPKMRF